eukprot:g624.t1
MQKAEKASLQEELMKRQKEYETVLSAQIEENKITLHKMKEEIEENFEDKLGLVVEEEHCRAEKDFEDKLRLIVAEEQRRAEEDFKDKLGMVLGEEHRRAEQFEFESEEKFKNLKQEEHFYRETSLESEAEIFAEMEKSHEREIVQERKKHHSYIQDFKAKFESEMASTIQKQSISHDHEKAQLQMVHKLALEKANQYEEATKLELEKAHMEINVLTAQKKSAEKKKEEKGAQTLEQKKKEKYVQASSTKKEKEQRSSQTSPRRQEERGFQTSMTQMEEKDTQTKEKERDFDNSNNDKEQNDSETKIKIPISSPPIDTEENDTLEKALRKAETEKNLLQGQVLFYKNLLNETNEGEEETVLNNQQWKKKMFLLQSTLRNEKSKFASSMEEKDKRIEELKKHVASLESEMEESRNSNLEQLEKLRSAEEKMEQIQQNTLVGARLRGYQGDPKLWGSESASSGDDAMVAQKQRDVQLRLAKTNVALLKVASKQCRGLIRELKAQIEPIDNDSEEAKKESIICEIESIINYYAAESFDKAPNYLTQQLKQFIGKEGSLLESLKKKYGETPKEQERKLRMEEKALLTELRATATTSSRREQIRPLLRNARASATFVQLFTEYSSLSGRRRRELMKKLEEED